MERFGEYEAHYPYNGQKNIPLRFVPELPNPIPEREDQATLGYPITYQLGPDLGGGELKMSLFRKGEEVPCFYSTPLAPTNPLIAPDRCYCLIPKEPLKPNSSYEVRIEGPGVISSFSFETGR